MHKYTFIVYKFNKGERKNEKMALALSFFLIRKKKNLPCKVALNCKVNKYQ